MIHVIVVCLIVFTSLRCVQSQLTCPDVVCPSQPTTCTCRVTGGVLSWVVVDTNGVPIGNVAHVRAGSGVNFNLNQSYPLSNSIPFNSMLTDTTNPVINATLSFIVGVVIYNGYRIECVDGADTTLAATIAIPPGSPAVVPNTLSFTPNSFTSVTLSWMMPPSDLPCLTGYQLAINGSMTIFISSITTTSHILTDRMRGIQYYFIVSVLDTGNRLGPPSDSQYFTLDTPLQPVIKKLFYQFPENSSNPNGTANVTLEWMQPTSSRPPVTIYRVIHNISNTGNNVTTTVRSPTITITGATLGSTYSILIIPNNTLGVGPASQIIIVVPTKSLTDLSSSGGLGDGAIIVGIIVGVIIVIANIILTVVLILVCVEMCNKRNKNNDYKTNIEKKCQETKGHIFIRRMEYTS